MIERNIQFKVSMSGSNPPMPLRPNLRAEWLLNDQITFLNHGSFGALPRVVFDAQTEWRRRIEADPIELLGRRAPELVANAKRPVGALLGMRDDDFGLVTNATEGINAVLQSLEIQPGDELLTTTHVYNAVRQAMKLLAERRGATYREVDIPLPVASAEGITALVVGAFSSRTRLLVVDHVTSPTALIFPVHAIASACAERGVDLLVDGAHAPAMLPLDVPGVGAAYYAGNLHKWPCAPKGCAFLWVRPDLQSRVHPLAVSHLHGQGLSREFSWQGTRDFSSWLSIPRAFEFMADLGWERIREHNHRMAIWVQRMLCERWGVTPISPIDGSMIGSMATVPLPPPLDRLGIEQSLLLQQRLYSEYQIEVPVTPFGGRILVRPCCQVYNAPADYERLAEVVSTMAAG